METPTCIIVDDEPIAAGIIQKHVEQYRRLRLLAKCPNALEAFDVLHKQPVDLMFLDIKMPAISGIQFLHSLKKPPAVIFTTAFPEHAIDGFELDIVDFLLKPVTYERFEKSMEKYFRMFQPATPEKEYSFFKVSGEQVKVFHADILYAQSVKDYIQLKTKNGQFLTYLTMKELAGLLPASLFARVHRSYLINRNEVQVYSKNYLQVAGVRIPIGKLYRPDSIK